MVIYSSNFYSENIFVLKEFIATLQLIRKWNQFQRLTPLKQRKKDVCNVSISEGLLMFEITVNMTWVYSKINLLFFSPVSFTRFATFQRRHIPDIFPSSLWMFCEIICRRIHLQQFRLLLQLQIRIHQLARWIGYQNQLAVAPHLF